MPDEPLKKRGLIKLIAQETRVDAAVVEVVLDRFVDVAMEELVRHGRFPLEGFFKVKEYRVKGGFTGIDGRETPPTLRLRGAVSRRVSLLYRLQRFVFPDKPGLVNRDTWKGALQWARGPEGSAALLEGRRDNLVEAEDVIMRNGIPLPPKRGAQEDPVAPPPHAEDNPFLLEEDE